MKVQNGEYDVSLRGFALFVVSLFLGLTLFFTSEQGMTWQIWGMLGMAFLGFCQLLRSLNHYGKWLSENETKTHN